MILLTNGCSWTWGGCLDVVGPDIDAKRKLLVWPHHLGQIIGADSVVNLSLGCGSNQRVVRTTYEWILAQDPQTLKDVVAVIQWTEPSRYEYYQPIDVTTWTENIPENWAMCKANVCLQNSEPEKYALARNQKRLETWTLQEGQYQHLIECEALAGLFARFGIKFFYWSFVNDIRYQQIAIRDYHLSNFPWIDDPLQDHGYWKYDRISEVDAHPSVTGHEQLADIIHSQIKDKV